MRTIPGGVLSIHKIIEVYYSLKVIMNLKIMADKQD